MKKIKSLIFIALVSFSSLLFAAQVNINTADADTLSNELSGVGQSKAQAIVAYRDQHGPYQHVEDLANVKGIGFSIIEKNRLKVILK